MNYIGKSDITNICASIIGLSILDNIDFGKYAVCHCLSITMMLFLRINLTMNFIKIVMNREKALTQSNKELSV